MRKMAQQAPSKDKSGAAVKPAPLLPTTATAAPAAASPPSPPVRPSIERRPAAAAAAAAAATATAATTRQHSVASIGTISPGYDALTSGAIPTEEVRGFADFSDVEGGSDDEAAQEAAASAATTTEAPLGFAEVEVAAVPADGEEVPAVGEADLVKPNTAAAEEASAGAVEAMAASPPQATVSSPAASPPASSNGASEAGTVPKRPTRTKTRLQKEREAARLRAERAASASGLERHVAGGDCR